MNNSKTLLIIRKLNRPGYSNDDQHKINGLINSLGMIVDSHNSHVIFKSLPCSGS